jgi:hypothetical protein
LLSEIIVILTSKVGLEVIETFSKHMKNVILLNVLAGRNNEEFYHLGYNAL